MKPVPLAGKRFGRLVVLSAVRYAHACVCDCGNTVTVARSNLTNGHTQSCGCLRLETTIGRSTKHGGASRGKHVRSYGIWTGIRKRCFDKNCKSWKDYGGRGITISERWLDYENFREDMGEPPPGHMIERRDNDGPYSKENCCWVTHREQARNKRTSKLITYNGKTLPLVQWAEELNKNHGVLRSRLHRGWSVERAFA